MENMKDSKLSRFVYYVTLTFFILFVVMFSVLSLIQSSYMGFTGNEHDMIYKNLFSIGGFIVFVIVLMLIFFISKISNKVSSKIALIIEMIIFAIIGIVYCLSYDNIGLAFDTKSVYESARSLVNGDYSVIDSVSYIGVFSNNFGIFTVYYLFLYIFGDTIAVLKYMRLFNLIFCIAGYVYLYKITDILYKNNRINLYLLLIFLGFNHLLFYSSFLYTNTLAYCFAIISIYYFIYYLKLNKRLWLSFIFIILAVFVRMNSLIILIAEIIILSIKALNEKKLLSIILVLVFVLGLFIPKLLVKYYEHKYQVVYNHQLPNKLYLYYGLNYTYDTPGGYFPDFTELLEEYDHDIHAVDNYGNYYLNDTLNYFKNNPLECFNFYIRKFISGWCDPNYDVFCNVFNESSVLEEYRPIMNDIYDGFLSSMAIGLLIYVIKKRKSIDYDFILVLSLVGGFIFHFFWEIKAIYTYQYILLLLPLSAYGLDTLFSTINKITK